MTVPIARRPRRVGLPRDHHPPCAASPALQRRLDLSPIRFAQPRQRYRLNRPGIAAAITPERRGKWLAKVGVEGANPFVRAIITIAGDSRWSGGARLLQDNGAVQLRGWVALLDGSGRVHPRGIGQISTWLPSSITRLVGSLKNCMALSALRTIHANSFSRQTAMPGRLEAIRVSRERK